MLEGFFFSWLPGYKTLTRLEQAVMTCCNQLLVKDKYCAGWGTEQGDSWGRGVGSLLPSFSMAAPSHVLGSASPLPRCLCEVPALGTFTDRPQLVTHHSASIQKGNGRGPVLWVWKCSPRLCEQPKLALRYPAGHWALPHDDLQGVKRTSPRKKKQKRGKMLLPGYCFHKLRARSRGQSKFCPGVVRVWLSYLLA